MNICKNKICILPNTTLYYPNELLHTLHTHCSQKELLIATHFTSFFLKHFPAATIITLSDKTHDLEQQLCVYSNTKTLLLIDNCPFPNCENIFAKMFPFKGDVILTRQIAHIPFMKNELMSSCSVMVPTNLSLKYSHILRTHGVKMSTYDDGAFQRKF